MANHVDKSHGAGRGDAPVMNNPHDMQIDAATGLPVAIAPDGEKALSEDGIDPREALRIDPKSRIPTPVQPDLA